MARPNEADSGAFLNNPGQRHQETKNRLDSTVIPLSLCSVCRNVVCDPQGIDLIMPDYAIPSSFCYNQLYQHFEASSSFDVEFQAYGTGN